MRAMAASAPFEDDVLRLLDVQVAGAEVIEDVREHARDDRDAARRACAWPASFVARLTTFGTVPVSCRRERSRARPRRRSPPGPGRSTRRCGACRSRRAGVTIGSLNSPVDRRRLAARTRPGRRGRRGCGRPPRARPDRRSPPRDVLMKYEPGFRRLRIDAPTKFRVPPASAR